MKLDTKQSRFKLSDSQTYLAGTLLDNFGFEKSIDTLKDLELDSVADEKYLDAEIYRQMIVLIVLSNKQTSK